MSAPTAALHSPGGQAAAPAASRTWVLKPLWYVTAVGLAAAMYLMPGEETIPYHLAWIAFVLTYGLTRWTFVEGVLAVLALSVVTGGAMVLSWRAGQVGWEELTEVPLMGLLAVSCVWHVRRREAAQLRELALFTEHRRRAAERERLSRMASHELRTPLAIVRGYAEQLRSTPEDVVASSQIIITEVRRLDRIVERLMRAVRASDVAGSHDFDLDELAKSTVTRWRPVAERQWEVSTEAGRVHGVPERFLAVLDTLLENAVRHTQRGDAIRVVLRRSGGVLLVRVSDSGLGLAEPDLEAVAGLSEPSGTLSRTGLGLALVREFTATLGGDLVATNGPDGGASFELTLPEEGLRARRSA